MIHIPSATKHSIAIVGKPGLSGWFAILIVVALYLTGSGGITTVKAEGKDRTSNHPSFPSTLSHKFQIGQLVYLQPSKSRPDMSSLNGYYNAEQLVPGWANMKYIFFGKVEDCQDLSYEEESEFTVMYGEQFHILEFKECNNSYYYLLDRDVQVWVKENSLVAREEELSPNGLYFTDEYIPNDRWRRPVELIETKISGQPVSFSLANISIEKYVEAPYNLVVHNLVLAIKIKNNGHKKITIAPGIAHVNFNYGHGDWKNTEHVTVDPDAEITVLFSVEIPTAGQHPSTEVFIAVNSITPENSGYYLIQSNSFFYKLDLTDYFKQALTPVPGVASNVTLTAPPSFRAPDLSCLKASKSEQGKVLEIIDGNTVKVLINDLVYIVRYLGVDIPEKTTAYWDKTGQSSAKNGELVYQKDVQLYEDAQEKDGSGRLLRYVVVGDIFVNYQLIYEGYTTTSTNDKLLCATLFQQAQQDSQKYSLGLWQPTPVYTPQSSITTSDSSSFPGYSTGGGNSSGGSTVTNTSGPTAICRDGTYSYSSHRRGTCSWHGGVSVWLR